MLESSLLFGPQSALQALFYSGKKLGSYVLQHDLVFASMQGLWGVHMCFCDRANAGLVVGRNDYILFLTHQ